MFGEMNMITQMAFQTCNGVEMGGDYLTDFKYVTMDEDKEFVITLEEYTVDVIPKIDIRTLSSTSIVEKEHLSGTSIYEKQTLPGTSINKDQLTKAQLIEVHDLSTHQASNEKEETLYGSNPNRIWNYWDEGTRSWKILKKSHIYKNLMSAPEKLKTAFAQHTIDAYNIDEPLTDENFPFCVYEEYTEYEVLKREYAFQVVHSAKYDEPIGSDPNDSSTHVYASGYVYYDEEPRPELPDFKIFYTPYAPEGLISVTDEIYKYGSYRNTVYLIPNKLEELDPNKITWSTPNKKIEIIPNPDGTATAEIITYKSGSMASDKVYFYMTYEGFSPRDHWVQFFKSGSGDPSSGDPTNPSTCDFEIIHKDDILTEITDWESTENTLNVNLVTDKDYDTYYWEYMTPTSAYAPLPNGQTTKATPEFALEHNKLYTFKLVVNKGTSTETFKTHTTQIIPLPNELQVKVTMSSPAEYNIHDIPEGSKVKVAPIKINLKPNFPSSTVINPDDWHWEVWLTGQNNLEGAQPWLLVSADDYDSNNPEDYEYLTTNDFIIPEANQLTLDKVTINGSQYAPYTYKELPYETTTITIPYWETDRDPDRLIIFDAYARLVCKDGRASDVNNYTSYTLLVDATPSPTYKEYIASIDNLAPENIIVEAGSSIPFTADASQINSIIVSANKDILTQPEYPNAGTATEFKANIQLTATGDYDDGKKYNLLTIKGMNTSNTHTATQQFIIRPNWYIEPPSTTTSSPLKIISVRDMRWQTLYNRPSDFSASTKFSLYENFGDKNLLTPVYLNNATGYSNTNNGGVDISKLKTGYAVEFELKVTDVFANYLKNDRNAKITIKTNANSLGLTYPQHPTGSLADYSTIELSKKTAEDSTYKFQVKQSNNYKTWKFIYYLPPTVKSTSSNTEATLKFTEIIADNNKGSTFNWMDLVKTPNSGLKYNWGGKVFTYDLTKNNLQDLGSNAN